MPFTYLYVHWVLQIRKMLKANEPSKCLFNDCVHLGEHGCVVKGDWERYPYYLQMLDEIKIRETIQLRTFGTKREGDVRYAIEMLFTSTVLYSRHLEMR
jgi:hypothetical protein